jgi:hypothetical protein
LNSPFLIKDYDDFKFLRFGGCGLTKSPLGRKWGSIRNILPYRRLRFDYPEDIENLNNTISFTWERLYTQSFFITRKIGYNYTTFGQFYSTPDWRLVMIHTPNFDIKEYNSIIRERLNNKPMCYNY